MIIDYQHRTEYSTYDLNSKYPLIHIFKNRVILYKHIILMDMSIKSENSEEMVDKHNLKLLIFYLR